MNRVCESFLKKALDLELTPGCIVSLREVKIFIA